jgi:hypothetical protein
VPRDNDLQATRISGGLQVSKIEGLERREYSLSSDWRTGRLLAKLADQTPSTAQILSPHVLWVNYMFLVRIDASFCGGDTMSIYSSPAAITICRILNSKAIQRLLSSSVEEERSSSAGRRRLRRKGNGVCAQ